MSGSRIRQTKALRAWAGTFATNIGSLVLGMATGICLARLLGVTDRGHLAEIIFISGIVTNLGSLSIAEAMTVETARTPGRPGLVASGLFLAVGLTALCATAFALIRPHVSDTPFGAVLSVFVGLRMLLELSGKVVTGVDRGEQRFVAVNAVTLLPQVVYLCGILALFAAGAVGVMPFAWTMLAGVALATLVRLLPRAGAIAAGVSREDLFRVLRSALRFHARQVLFIAQWGADRLIIISFLAAADLGLYAVALTVAGAGMNKIASTTVNVLLPKISGQADPEAQSRQLAASSGATLLVAAVLNGTLAVLSPWLVPFLFGQEFAGAVPLAIVLCFAQVPQCVLVVLSFGLQGLGDWKASSLAAAAALAVAVAVSLTLIGQLGPLAVALGLLIGNWLAAGWLVGRASAIAGRPWSDFLLPPRWMFSPANIRKRLKR